MLKFLLSTDPKQKIRMLRHLSSIIALMVFTVIGVFFHRYGLYDIDGKTLVSILLFFWFGVFTFTLILRTGFNKKFKDPSLTMGQIIWGTLYILATVYLMNKWRGLLLMAYFGMLSFGFFKLQFREFLSIILFAILGYSLIILYIFIKEPERINIDLELFQLLVFTCSTLVMLYTGSAVNRLRKRAKKQYSDLQQALEINKTLAITDDLTGLYNRRYFMEKLLQQKSLSKRDDSDFVVFYCDLDHFKNINDTFGHHTGDVVLQKFSEILKTSIREIDYAARFGGEEFVCLLVNTDVENSRKITERICESLDKYNFNDIAPSLHATVSIGIANFKQFNTIQETLMAADNRMYLAKELGRNRIVFTGGDDDAKTKTKTDGSQIVDLYK